MSASITAPRGLQTLNPSPEISRYYNKVDAPYINTAQVLSEVLLPVRYPGQTFLVVDEEWWFKSGKLDADLVLKQDSGTGITDLDYTPSPTQGTVTSSTGTDAIISLADNTNAGLMSPSDKETLYDNVIYRSGTEAGKPITGDLEINGDGDERFIFNGNNPAQLYKNGIWFTDDGLIGFKSTDGIDTTTLLNQNAQFALDSTNPGFKGIVGSNFFDKEEDLNAFAQLGDLTPLENDIFELQMNKANQDTTYTKTEVDAKVASVYKIRGSVANFASLPSSGQVSGDVWNLLDNGDNYAWVLDLNNTGLPGWDKLSGSVDLTAYETKVVAESKYLQIVNASATVLATVLSGISFLTGGAIVSTDSVLVAFGKFQKQLNDFGIALGLKQDTLNEDNFGTFTNSVADKNTQSDTDVLSYVDITTGKWVKQTFTKLVDYLRGFFVDKTTNQSIDGIKTFTASPIVPNATTSNQAVNLGQLKNLVKSISITDIIPHTGTTASTKVAELVIPANTILDNEIWEIEYCVTRDATNATGTVSLSIYIDGAETGSNAFVRGLTFPAGNYYRSKGLRTLFFKNGKVRRFNNSGVFITDNGSMQFNTISDIDLTIENKLIINFSLAVSTDTANLEYVIFKKIN